MGLQPHYITKNEVIEINEQTPRKLNIPKALSSDAGKDLLERLRQAEEHNQAVRRVRPHANTGEKQKSRWMEIHEKEG